MVHELPLLLGAIGTVIGFFTLPWILFLLALGYASATDYPLDYATPLSSELFALAWAVSPLLGLVGALEVKKHGVLRGLLFLTAGILPRLGGFLAKGIVDSGTVIFFFRTPPLFFAGILAVLNLPGPYVDKEDLDDQADRTPSPNG